MGRLLFWGLMILCVLLALRLALRNSPKTAPKAAPKTRSRPNAPTASVPMVQCAHCGVYLPRSDALQLHDQTWRCREHAGLPQQVKP